MPSWKNHTRNGIAYGIRWLSYVLPIAPIGFGTSQWMVMGWSWDGHPTMNGLMAHHPIKIHRSSDSEDSVKRATWIYLVFVGCNML